MKVLIIGAGVSGMTCAIRLKKYGIIPKILEKKSRIGESLEFGAVLFNMLNKGISDPVVFFKENNLDINANYKLKSIRMICEDVKLDFYGNMGYTLVRGQTVGSIENQLYKQLALPVMFDTYVDIEYIKKIKKRYDYVIDATGGKTIPDHFGLWENRYHAVNRVATVIGNFEELKPIIWFNSKYANNGFAYLVPINEKMAKLALVCSDTNSNQINYYWNKFLDTEKILGSIIDIKDMEHFCSSGHLKSLTNENIMFIGNAAGMTDSFIGNGAFKAIQSGIIAGDCIGKGLDYKKAMKPINEELKVYDKFRSVVKNYENKEFKKLIKILHAPIINNLVYKNPLFKLNDLQFFVKLLSKKNK